MSKFDEAVLTRLESAQWKDRGDALDVIAKHVNSPGLCSATAIPISKGILQVIGTDKHRVLVIKAATILQQMVERLQDEFTPHAERSLRVLIAKFKETKQNLVVGLRAASRAVLETMPLDTALGVLQSSLENPSASVQTECTYLLAHLLCLHSPSALVKDTMRQPQRLRLVQSLLPALYKISQHRDSACRDASFQAFASMQLFLNADSKQMDALTDGMLDVQRRVKVEAALDLLKLTVAEQKAKNQAKRNRSKSRTTSPGFTDLLTTPGSSVKDGIRRATPRRQALRERNVGAVASASKPSQSVRRVQSVGRRRVPTAHTILSYDELMDGLSDFFLAVPANQLVHSNWKLRLAAAEAISSKLNSCTDTPEHILNLVVQFLVQSEKLCDINLQVRCLLLDTLAVCLQRLKKFNHVLVEQLVQALCAQLLPSLTQIKAKKSAQDALLGVLFNTKCSATFLSILDSKVKEAKKPALHAAALEWLSAAVRGTNIRFDLDQVARLIEESLLSTNPDVKGHAIILAGVVHTCPWNQNDRLRHLLTVNEKPALMQRLIAEFERCELEMDQRSGSSSSCSSTHSSASVTNTAPADATFAFGRGSDDMLIATQADLDDGPTPVKRGQSMESRLSSLEKVTHTKGQIKAVTGPATGSITSSKPSTGHGLFLTRTVSVAELMEEKQKRLSKLNRMLCIDFVGLRAAFDQLYLNPHMIQIFFAPSVLKRLETLDLLIASLDESSGDRPTGIPAVELNYACFDLLLAWTVGACFSYGGGTAEDQSSQASHILSSWSDLNALISRGLQYLTLAISRFAEAEFQLSEQEVFLLLEALLSDQAPSIQASVQHRNPAAVGTSLDPLVRNAVNDLIRLSCQVYPVSGLIEPIANLLHQSRNTTGRLICLQQLVNLFPKNMGSFDFSLSLKPVAQQLADSNAEVRRLTLEFLQLAHQHIGTAFWRHVGPLRSDDREVLEKHLGEQAPPLEQCDHSTTLIHTGPRDLESHGLSTLRSSNRTHSPTSAHAPPTIVAGLLSLICEQNNPKTTASNRAAAAERLNWELASLVSLLDLNKLQDDSSATTVAERSEADDTSITVPETEDEICRSPVFSAVFDLQQLIRDPTTRNLLVPFVNSIVLHLVRLFQAMSTVGNVPSHMSFLECIVALVMVLFEQPFLAREANDNVIILLLASLFHLASRDQLRFPHLLPHLPPSAERVLLLRLVSFLLAHIGSGCTLRVLLRLLSISALCMDCADGTQLTAERRHSLRRRSSTDAEVGEANLLLSHYANTPHVRELVLSNLYHFIPLINRDASEIDWSTVYPLFESFLTYLLNPERTKSKRRRSSISVPDDVLSSVDRCVQIIVVSCYARMGSAFRDDAAKVIGQKSTLVEYLKGLQKTMPNAPYRHCLP